MRVTPVRTLSALLLFSGSIQAATPAQLDSARNQGLAWLFTHQPSEGQWQSPGGLPVQTTAAAVDALKNAGITGGYFYAGAVAWLRNAEALSNDALARQIGALSTTGTNTQALVTALLTNRTDTSKAWGALPKYQGSFPDTALAMDALLLTNTSYADTGRTLSFISSKQNADGGWSYGANASVALQSQLIPSAYNTLTLSRAKLAGWDVDAYITTAVNWLVSLKKSDNGFAEDSAATTGSVYETALVYLAIAKAKQADNAAAVAAQTVLEGAQDFLVVQQSNDGGWNGDALATALALQALPTVTLADTDKDGIPDSIEPLLGTNSAMPDGRQLVTGNGAGDTGTTAPLVLGNSSLGQAMNSALAEGGGTGPFTWSLVSGSLPTGTTLDGGTGVISGTPSTAGTFNFTYQVKDSQGVVATSAAQIGVVTPAAPIHAPLDQAPTLLADSAVTVAGYAELIGVLKNDLNADGDPISLVSSTNGAHGVAQVMGSRIQYTANDAYAGIDSFSYTAKDGKGASAVATVTVTVYAKSGDEDGDGMSNYDERVARRDMFINEDVILLLIHSVLADE